MKKHLAIAALVVLPLAGCGATTGVAGSSTADAGATSAPKAENADAEATTDGSDGTVKFGKTFTWDDGLAVTVTAPKKFKPSEYAAMDPGKGTPVLMQVTIKNGSKKPFDAGVFTSTVQSNEEEASTIFDSSQKIEGAPSTKLLAGKTVKFKIAYKVLNPKDIVMEVSPDFLEHDAVIFTS